MTVAINRLVAELEPTTLSTHACVAALPEIDHLLATLGPESPALDQALRRLRRMLEQHRDRPAARIVDGHAAQRLRRALRLLAPLAAAAMSLAAMPAAADPVPPPPTLIGTVAVNGEILNPETGKNEKVAELIGNYAVRTDQNNVILLAQAVNDTYTVVTTDTATTLPTVTSVTYTVTGVTLDKDNHVTSITVKDDQNVVSTTKVVTALSYTPSPAGGGAGSGIVPITIPAGAGDVNVYTNFAKGGDGGNGRAGAGVRFCIPLIGCAEIAVSPTAGGDGAPGPTITATIGRDTNKPNAGNITSVSANRPGVIVVSAGGDGGSGGGAFGNIPAARGGTAGAGGAATAIVSVDIATTGENSHGILVQSMAGRGGNGGTGILASPGGASGSAATGGEARAYSSATILTSGRGAVGMLVQSLGGNAGTGGSSYGIVGQPGQGSLGGNGGLAYAENSGTIQTGGDFAHGMLAQSIGGSGGNSGTAGALVTLGDAAGAGGAGGSAQVRVTGSGSILTTGDFAHGAMAQSTGGGGGSANTSVGLIVSLGSAGSAAGKGGEARVTLDQGAVIETHGTGAYGIFSESVGGGGGTSGGSFGLVALGASAGAGGDGGTVVVDSDGSVLTTGVGARGVFAQSVGGGGGNANITGGAVALGGSGSAGGVGGTVTVGLGANSQVVTTNAGADAVFAQSVGGGGGAGSAAGGIASLGGKGGPGAVGGVVSVANAGLIQTEGAASRGIFAQSVGGGGGAGGDSYGLATIGGAGSGTSRGGDVTVGNSGRISTIGNRSTALQAQSIGGGGGDGGTSGGVFLSIGGNAGAGGDGGIVTVAQSGGLSTQGDDSHGIFAQSVGGGGGNAGSASSLSLFAGAAIGGDGGTGGLGGDTTVSFAPQTMTVGGNTLSVNPLITTAGDRSRGVFAQSVGGGGGSGGFAVQASIGTGFAASVAIGGRGGTGGAGGTVKVDGDVSIVTKGDNSEGMFLQSAGGGGGSGGYSIAAALSTGIVGAVSMTAGIGGAGGTGGVGGTVDVDSGGSIATQGEFSTGFLAQSVGGGGGTGGYNVSVAGAAGGAASLSLAVGIGGNGGDGGAGGLVDAVFDGAIVTSGGDAPGALIQSIGGGGGRGGYNVSGAVALSGIAGSGGVALGLGGSGASGGAGGDVIGRVGGNVQTGGARSTGILIQSLGGGGGSGGFNVSGTFVVSGGVTGGAAIGLGGVGGAAGDGGTVTGTAGGTILTLAEGSDGLIVQSLGGGGGAGGFNVSGNIGLSGGASGSVSVGLGGAGGGGGNGGTVTGSALGVVETMADRSRGVVVQSLGGGGGAGAFNISGDLVVGGQVAGSVGVGLGGSAGGGGTGGDVFADAVSITTHGDQSAGFIAQSIGGGGGAGGFNVTGGVALSGTVSGTIGVGFGGSGGDGGGAGSVVAGIVGNVFTEGAQSGAVLAQSVGGGGGAGGFNVTGGLAVSGSAAGTIGIGLGGSGGKGGIAGTVALRMTGLANTKGEDSDGIVAQSIGGGGGSGGFTITGGIAASGAGAGTIGVGLGGSGGDGGNGAGVMLAVNPGTLANNLLLAAAVTQGDRSRGIVAQSIGGGGGSGGFNITGGVSLASTGSGAIGIGIGGQGGLGGTGAAVSASIAGYTLTDGNHADGIVVQSLGGGGGAGGFDITGAIALAGTGAGAVGVGIGGTAGGGGASGAVTLAINEAVTTPGTDLVAAWTKGDDSRGILVQSLGGGGGVGGFTIAGAIGGAGTGAGAVTVGIGGSGGSGGRASTATADITGSTFTQGDDSTGVLVQSLGGGGGAGSFSVSGSVGIGGQGAGAVGIGIGGSGSDGGAGDAVTLAINQRTADPLHTLLAASTEGDRSTAILAQSIGGGGGNGGFGIGGAVSLASTGAGAIGVGIGGSGGGGGAAGSVGADISGVALTQGDDSNAILVQSLGGGGGAGGFALGAGLSIAKTGAGNVTVGIGGSGGAGGASAAVTLDVNQRTTDSEDTLVAAITSGDGSTAIIAQSIGGGGGAGGFSISGGVAMGSEGAGNIGFGLGGSGGTASNGSTVTAHIRGDIGTSGEDSGGLLLQSAGGGGGAGGFNVTGGVALSKGLSGNVLVGIGGFGGAGGNGALVEGTLAGDIVTSGDRAFGATLQSLGGAGGVGGFNITGGIAVSMGTTGAGNIGVGIGGFGGGGGNGGDVLGTLIGNISTSGVEAHGALLQSLGGGGGAGGFNVTGGIAVSSGTTGNVGFGLGGFGGDGGIGGNVTGTLIGNVVTLGDGSFGAMLQSVGGAGGQGALNVSGAINVTVNNNAAVGIALGIGGFGGGGGAAGDVTGSVTGSYYTDGRGADGVVAQSIGGGGGAGGLNVSGAITLSTGTSGAAAIGIGGFGGDGGAAGDVTLYRIGQTQTNGGLSDGVVAQSVGGGGGRGGINISGALAVTATGTGTGLAFGLGGFGGGGGDGGAVTAFVRDSVWATGVSRIVVRADETLTDADGDSFVLKGATQVLDGSNGVFVQSIGGGGGAGGMDIVGGMSFTKFGGSSKARVGAIGIGGFGGDGGNGGVVSTTIGGAAGAARIQIEGVGDDKSAVYVASIGGGGGSGGINISGGISTDGQLVVGVGGFGGDGGTGGKVTVSSDADLFASGARANGLFVQSLGGGGGNGGINISGGLKPQASGTKPSLVFGVGGYGGAGNVSDDVSVVQVGQVRVDGEGAHGLLIQSVAGGGGAGGLDIVGNINRGGGTSKVDGVALAVGIGGSGGAGADAGDVSLTSAGDVLINTLVTTTDGVTKLTAASEAGNAPGILVQSIGGGGGVGAINAVGVAAPAGTPLAVGVGGSGGAGSDAGNVTVDRGYTLVNGSPTESRGLINTFGVGSAGLVAQSIGGGGGSAGMNFVFAYSSAQPGGATAYGAVFAIGGDGASSGAGGDVTVRQLGDIQTDGFGSDGLLAQSIAKGGGNAALNVGLGVMKDVTALTFSLGGAAGDGGVAGNVSVAHDGTILTRQGSSSAIVAQSIAGGGGNVSTSTATAARAGDKVGVNIGREGGKGGTAGAVLVNAAGVLTTVGDDSNGIVAQSIGGSGGVSGSISIAAQEKSGTDANAKTSSFGLSVGLEGGAAGRSGTVTVDNDAAITTSGARSRGIVAQSIGGDGGIAGSGSASVTGDDVAVGIAIGGAGGDGAVSDVVLVNNRGLIRTAGTQSDGILAQSLGGGGGVGGSASSTELSVKDTANKDASSVMIAVGGSGGAGAVGGDVSVANSGTILTLGDTSAGIRAQSIGGGGGVGGGVLSVHINKFKSSNAYDLNIGGSGGTGMSAGNVAVTNTGLIYTVGRDSAGISATSIGGGGGDAGMVLDVGLGLSSGGGNQYRTVVNLGGSGGSGGAGGAVQVINWPTALDDTGVIVTEGENSHGIFAQSLGGGGGNGTSILSLTGLKGSGDSLAIGLNIGGSGGTGNVAGDVSVDNSGVIETFGDNAHGILAQSIGGGGGNGGIAIAGSLVVDKTSDAPLLAIGGFGGEGGNAGDVTVLNSGSILTHGTGANGVVAQSIGGGGGNAGMGLVATGNAESMILSNGLAALLGAVGSGDGGTGGAVTVVHSGDITVLGDKAEAIVAESINGGGGRLTLDLNGLGALTGVPITLPGGVTVPTIPVVAMRIGSESSRDMNAGKVSVTSTGTIGNAGANGAGITLQSIGGGGGTVNLTARVIALADLAAGDVQAPIAFRIDLGSTKGTNNAGGAIEATHTGMVLTSGDGSAGVIAQSVGGGGGRGVMDIAVENIAMFEGASVALGATDSVTSAGGAIQRSQDGAIVTTGALAPGAVVQSIGGGGGSMLLRVATVSAASAAVSRLVVAAVPDVSGKTALSLGAIGGSGNDGGAVATTFSGGFQTEGAHSTALIVQSIGGGGGEVRIEGDSSPAIRLGGQGGASGNGGAVSLVNTGAVITSGTGSNGIVLQSIGGGGGVVGGDFTGAVVTLDSANSGNGGAITLTQTGDIVTSGDRTYALLAQSLGGGGGLVDGVFAGTAGGVGRGAAIDLDVDGSVLATGVNSTAIAAQSLGSLGGGNVTIATSGAVRGGSGTGAGVWIDGGADNLLTSAGSLSAVSGLAVLGGAGNDAVVNQGLMVGNARLGSGTNRLTNAAGATLITIDTLQLESGAGSAGTFVNAGTLLLGLSADKLPIDLLAGDTFPAYVSASPKTDLLSGTAVISQVALAGDAVQTATGHSVWDVAFGPYASDRINVAGNATVAGTADVTLTWLENSNAVPLFATTGGVGVDQGLKVRDTLAIDYNILAGTKGIELAFTSNFGLDFLNRNERALGRSLDSAVQVGDSGGIGRLLALLGNLSTGQEALYKSIMAQLDPEIFLMPSLAQLDAARDFGSNVFGCHDTAIDRNVCVWGNAGLSTYARDQSRGDFAVKPDNTARLRAGVERRLENDWKLGASFGYDDIGTIRFAGLRGDANGNGLHIGVGVAKGFGTDAQGALSLALSAGRQVTDLQRTQTVFVTARGTSRFTTDYGAATANLGYTLTSGVMFARPEVEGAVIGIGYRGFQEAGLDGLGIEGLRSRDWVASVAPKLTLGVEPVRGVRLSVNGGGVFRDQGQLTAPLRLIGASDAADPARITTRFDKTSWTAGANLVISESDRVGVDVGYRTERGNMVKSDTVRFTAKLRF